MHCTSLWIKASAKCINVNVNVILLFDNVFFFFLLFPEMRRVFEWKMLVLLFTDAETLGSDHKVKSYYNYYM